MVFQKSEKDNIFYPVYPRYLYVNTFNQGEVSELDNNDPFNDSKNILKYKNPIPANRKYGFDLNIYGLIMGENSTYLPTLCICTNFQIQQPIPTQKCILWHKPGLIPEEAFNPKYKTRTLLRWEIPLFLDWKVIDWNHEDPRNRSDSTRIFPIITA
jgi:hypothetical protein